MSIDERAHELLDGTGIGKKQSMKWMVKKRINGQMHLVHVKSQTIGILHTCYIEKHLNECCTTFILFT